MAKKKAKVAKPEADAKKEDDEIVVLCFKVLVMPRPLVPGCSKVPCGTCGQMVWISSATAAHMVGKVHRISCAECVANDPDPNPDMQVMTPSEGQIAEIIATGSSITAAKLRRTFPASNPAKRKAAMDDILRRTKRRKRFDN